MEKFPQFRSFGAEQLVPCDKMQHGLVARRQGFHKVLELV